MCLYEALKLVCVSVCVCVTELSHVCTGAVRVCANCKSMSLLIPIRAFALLWFGGMGGGHLEVADQYPQKSSRIPSSRSLPAPLASLSLLCWSPSAFHFASPALTTEQLINSFIYSFIFLITFHHLHVFFFSCNFLHRREVEKTCSKGNQSDFIHW